MDLIQFQSESQLTIFLWKLVRKVSGMIKIFFKENKKRDLPYQMSLKECSKSDKIDQKKNKNFETEENLATDSHIYKISMYDRLGVLE